MSVRQSQKKAKRKCQTGPRNVRSGKTWLKEEEENDGNFSKSYSYIIGVFDALFGVFKMIDQKFKEAVKTHSEIKSKYYGSNVSDQSLLCASVRVSFNEGCDFYASLVEPELTKLRAALDVAKEALRNIEESNRYCDTNHSNEAFDALARIKESAGGGNY